MIMQVEPVGSFERKRADVAELEALATLVRELNVQLDVYVRAAFERLVDLAGTREFLHPFCTFQQYLIAIKNKRDEQLAAPYGSTDGDWTAPPPTRHAAVVDPLFIFDFLRMSYEQRPGVKAAALTAMRSEPAPALPVPAATAAPLLRVAPLGANEDAALEAGQQVFVKFMRRSESAGPEGLHAEAHASAQPAAHASDAMDVSPDDVTRAMLERAYAASHAVLDSASAARTDYDAAMEQLKDEPVQAVSEFATAVASPVFFTPMLSVQLTAEQIAASVKGAQLKPIITALDANPQQLPSPVSPASSLELLATKQQPMQPMQPVLIPRIFTSAEFEAQLAHFMLLQQGSCMGMGLNTMHAVPAIGAPGLVSFS